MMLGWKDDAFADLSGLIRIRYTLRKHQIFYQIVVLSSKVRVGFLQLKSGGLVFLLGISVGVWYIIAHSIFILSHFCII